jgi:hypothetical protein
MRTWHCVNCDRLLVEAPTDKGHMDCGPHGKICFDCIDRMVFSMKAVRAALAPQPEAEKGFDYAKNFLEISLRKVPYAEFDDYYVEKVCGAGVFTTLFYLREFAKQKGK